jgi:autotransporter-associated beta strand protein
MIPTLRSWVATNYPGTKIGITEYNWSLTEYDNTIAGAVIQAEVLGIFGREGLDLATRWGSSANSPSNLIFKAMKMYRNYDGRRSAFGDVSIAATTSANPDEINAFAAERSTDGALTLMAVNKQLSGTRSTTFSLSNFAHRGTAQTWRLDSTGTISRLGDLTVTGNSLSTTLPPQTITIYVLPTAANLIAAQVTAPVPANGALNVPTSLTAVWTPAANTSLYHVYLGTSLSAVAAATTASPEYRGASATPDFDLTSLSGTTTYYWRVDAEATGGTNAGTVWSFTTAAPPRGIVTLINGDGFGSSSYNSAGNWSNSAVPSIANDYFTSNKELRSPSSASGTSTFGGYSLSLDSSGTLTTKGANNNILAIERFFLNGGRVRVGDDNNLATISGSIAQVLAASTLDADKAGRTLVLASPLTGSGRLTIASGTGSGGVVRLSGVNDGFTGPWTINTGATLQVGNGGSTGSLGSGDLIHNGALTFNRTGQLNIPGDISGNGTLTLNSALALTLDGASTYSGTTTISNGSLYVTGSLGNTTVTVASAATLGGAGSFAGTVTVQGALAPGATGTSSTGHLTFGSSLTLATTTATRIELNRTAAVTHDALTVSGTFTAAGALVITNIGTALVAGDTFSLFNKAPTSGSFASVTLPALPSGLSWQNNLTVNGTLTVLGPPPPAPATTPAPADAATAVAMNTSLNWTAGAGATAHRVYLGTDSVAVAAATPATAGIYQGEQATTAFTPSAALANAATYYWRIDEVGAGGVTTGPVWSFTTVLTAYDQWALAQGLTPGLNDASAADPDLDGISNLLEFVLAGNPLQSAPGIKPSINLSGGNLLFTFLRADAAEPGATLSVQYGNDLTTWTDVPIGATSSVSGTVAVNIVENASAPDAVTVTIPLNPALRLFTRLRVIRP